MGSSASRDDSATKREVAAWREAVEQWQHRSEAPTFWSATDAFVYLALETGVATPTQPPPRHQLSARQSKHAAANVAFAEQLRRAIRGLHIDGEGLRTLGSAWVGILVASGALPSPEVSKVVALHPSNDCTAGGAPISACIARKLVEACHYVATSLQGPSAGAPRIATCGFPEYIHVPAEGGGFPLFFHVATALTDTVVSRAPRDKDWESQPSAYRRYYGAPIVPLEWANTCDAASGGGGGASNAVDPVTYDVAAATQHDYGATPSAFDVPVARLRVASMSSLFLWSLANAAYKRGARGTVFHKRVNPSSGCLHPVECYLMLPSRAAGQLQRSDAATATGAVGAGAGAGAGVGAGAGTGATLFHYAPKAHVLEVRGSVSPEAWACVSTAMGLPTEEACAAPSGSGTIPTTTAGVVVLSLITWRQVWKYGERGFRYAHLDAGHAAAALALAAAALGWRIEWVHLPTPTAADSDSNNVVLSRLLGLPHVGRAEFATPLSARTDVSLEPELPTLVGVLWFGRCSKRSEPCSLSDAWRSVCSVAKAMSTDSPSGNGGDESACVARHCEFYGVPNRLSSRHTLWPLVEEATRRTHCDDRCAAASSVPGGGSSSVHTQPSPSAGATRRDRASFALPGRTMGCGSVVRARRSAYDFDDSASPMAAQVFAHTLQRMCQSTMVTCLPHRHDIVALVYVLRVDGIKPGVYVLDLGEQLATLQAVLSECKADWVRVPNAQLHGCGGSGAGAGAGGAGGAGGGGAGGAGAGGGGCQRCATCAFPHLYPIRTVTHAEFGAFKQSMVDDVVCGQSLVSRCVECNLLVSCRSLPLFRV